MTYFLLCTLLIVLVTSVAASCGGDKPRGLCCMGLAPFSTNAYVWGGICGYTPSSQSELIGGRCITLPSSGICPIGSISTCCAGTWPGPSGQCALGTNCGIPTVATTITTTTTTSTSSTSFTTSTSTSTTSTPATVPPSATPSFIPAPLPDGWTQTNPCAQDDSSRILSNDITTQLTSNTPASCIAHCSANGYAFAGVEYGNECHCGTGFRSGSPSAIAPSQCNVACAGDGRYSCGGPWAIQLYIGPAQTEALPDDWTLVHACSIDNADRVFADDDTAVLSDNTPATCIAHCASLGFNYAGVEYGDECHCGTSYTGGDQASASDCNIPCSGNSGLTCGGSWRIQIYSSATDP